MMKKEGKNAAAIGEMNRALVLEIVHRHGQTTRAEIVKKSGLNQATITNIINEFIDGGIIREVGLIAGSRGRRSIAIEFVSEKYIIIGIRFTRKHFWLGAFDLQGKTLYKECFRPGLQNDQDLLLETVEEQISKVRTRFPESIVLGIGVALPGPFMKSENKIALLTEAVGAEEFDIVKRLQEKTGVRIYAEHDANAAAMAEWSETLHYDPSVSLMCIMMGQGIGSGIIEKGNLITGAVGTAGEIGHMSIQYDGPLCECGNRGCLELYCSTISVQRKVKELLPEYPQTVCAENSTITEIINAYKEGDVLARRIVNDAARYLGFGIANLVNIINPGKIIIGDELSKAGEDFLTVVRETVKERVIPEIYNKMDIDLSELENSALRGTYRIVLKNVLSKPELFLEENKAAKDTAKK